MYIVKQRKLKAVFILKYCTQKAGFIVYTKDIKYRKTVYTKDNLYCYKGLRTHAPYHDRFHLDLFLICILWPR